VHAFRRASTRCPPPEHCILIPIRQRPAKRINETQKAKTSWGACVTSRKNERPWQFQEAPAERIHGTGDRVEAELDTFKVTTVEDGKEKEPTGMINFVDSMVKSSYVRLPKRPPRLTGLYRRLGSHFRAEKAHQHLRSDRKRPKCGLRNFMCDRDAEPRLGVDREGKRPFCSSYSFSRCIQPFQEVIPIGTLCLSPFIRGRLGIRKNCCCRN